MNINDVIALSRAGFTSEQIAQMAVAEQQQPAPAADPEPAAPAAPAQPAPAPAAPAAPAPNNQASFDAIMAAIGGLKTQLLQQAIQNSQQPAQQRQSAEDMLASIINPPTAANDNK